MVLIWNRSKGVFCPNCKYILDPSKTIWSKYGSFNLDGSKMFWTYRRTRYVCFHLKLTLQWLLSQLDSVITISERWKKCLTCIQFLQHKTQSDYAIAQNLFGICDHWWEQIQNDRRIEIGDLFWQCWLIGAWRPEIWDIDIGFSVDFLTPNSIPNINQRLLKYFILYNFHIFIKIIKK